MRSKFWLALSCAGLVFGGGVAVIVWQARTNQAQGRRIEQISGENRQLQARAADLVRQLAAARAAAQAPPSEEHPAASPQSPGDSQYAHMAVEQVHTIQQLQDKLAQSTASITQLENRILDFQAQVHQLSTDKDKLTASESDLRDNLASTNLLVDALQKELKAKNDRIAQTEISDQKLRRQTTSDSQRIAEITQGIKDLQEIHRRQENALNTILRRYRDVTDQYRSIAGMLENRRGDPGVINTVDLSRIQNSIALAEEDLRQFTSLSAQAQRIERKITGKSP